MTYDFIFQVSDPIIEELIRAGLVTSKNEFKRLAEQGGVHLIMNQVTIKIGKRKYLKLTFHD